MNELDLEFIGESLFKYLEHLMSVQGAVNSLMESYKKNETELTRLAEFKPETYTKPLEEIKRKIVEADIKLSHIVPRIKKINEQLDILIAKGEMKDPALVRKD